MNFRKPQSSFSPVVITVILWLVVCSSSALAQREYTVVKPRERSASEKVAIRSKAAQASKGVLGVILQPVVNGQIVVKDAAGKIIETAEAGDSGVAQFDLRRGTAYQVEANYPGYLGVTGKSKPLTGREVIRLRLIPQSVAFNLRGLPAGAQVFIDDKLRVTVDSSGVAAFGEIEPGKHSLLISHPEFNDYVEYFDDLVAGSEVNYGRIPLTRVAKLTIQGPAGATVLINGALQGKINADGAVRIDYELDRASERTISVELTGYQTSSLKEVLAPGPRTLTFKLDPVVTSTGVTDFFDSFLHWNAPSTWKLVGDDRNRKLRVEGPEPGLLKDKIYRDIHEDSNFIIWLDDGKGATWLVRADKEGRNYYLFHLAGPKSTTHIPRRFYTYVVRDGGTPEPVSTPVPVSMELNQKTSYTINIKVTGYTIQHSITSFQKQRPQAKEEETQTDDLGIWTDNSVTRDKFLFGTFGFRSLAGEVFTVDDLNLEPAKNK